MFNLDNKFLSQFTKWLRDCEKSDDLINDIRKISRFLAVCFVQNETAASFLDNFSHILRLWNKETVIKFFKTMQQCGADGETIRLYQRSVKLLLSYF